MHHPLWVVRTTSLFVVSESLILDAYIINKACIIATHHRDLVVHTTRCRWYVPPEVGGRNVLFYYNIFNVSFSRCSIRLSSMHHPLWVVCTTCFVVSESLILDAYIKACIEHCLVVRTTETYSGIRTTGCRW